MVAIIAVFELKPLSFLSTRSASAVILGDSKYQFIPDLANTDGNWCCVSVFEGYIEKLLSRHLFLPLRSLCLIHYVSLASNSYQVWSIFFCSFSVLYLILLSFFQIYTLNFAIR